MKQRKQPFATTVPAVVLGLMFSPFVQAAPLRPEQSLNGEWGFTPDGGSETTITVPSYWDSDPRFGTRVKQATYERELTVPSSWLEGGRRVKVEFDSVLYAADVYVGNSLVTSNVGGWKPFTADITPHIRPGKPFTLRVLVKGGSLPPTVDDKGLPLWPVAIGGHQRNWGICFDVWLRNYGPVHIQDSFVQTSYRKKTLTVDYELKNADTRPHTIVVEANAVPRNGSRAEFRLKSESVTLQPGAVRKIVASGAWPNAHLWNPDDPFLYVLKSAVVEQGGGNLDTEDRQFGFREIWIEGNRYMYNGHRLNLHGDNFTHHFNPSYIQSNDTAAYARIIDRVKKLNINFVRYHTGPARPYVLDICDEKGLFVMWETPVYSRGYMIKANIPAYLENCRKWMEPFVKAARNHPSIIIWSAENEFGKNYIRAMTDSEMKSLGDAMTKHDPTRPINYDGEMDIGAETVNLHYPAMYLNRERGEIYSWDRFVHPSKPTGIGELFYGPWDPPERKAWCTAAWVRGLRYVNYAEFRVFTLAWTWMDSGLVRTGAGSGGDLASDPNWEKRLEGDTPYAALRNGYAPVALFDKEYDRPGGDVAFMKDWPRLFEGSRVNRTLILYNDEYSGTDITVRVKVVCNGKETAHGEKSFSLPLGEHVDIPISFQVPTIELARPGGERPVVHNGMPATLVLQTFKGGVLKFEEPRTFLIRETDYAGPVSAEVTIGDARGGQSP
jgi:hypothetical protein